MFQLQMFIPLTDNQNAEFTEEHHAQFELEIVRRFMGVSLLPGAVAGTWSNQGQIYRDQLRVYEFGVSSITQGSLIAELADVAKVHYGQEAVYIRYLGISEIL